MKKRFFSPIVMVFLLAILAISTIIYLKPKEEIALKKVTFKSRRLDSILKNNLKRESTNSSTDLITIERAYTETEIQNTTADDFSQMILDTESRLPTLSDIKQIPSGALHHIPSVILEAGRNIGVLKEVIKIHPEYEDKIIPLYQNCAQAENRPTTVRALCLTNLIELSKRHNLVLDLKKFPPKIVELTKLVTDM